MEDLKLSGYTEKDRKTILKGGIETYDKIKDKENRGERPFYRSNSFNKDKRKKEKQNKKTRWFKKSEDNIFSTVMFVECTPEEKLIKMLKDTEERFMVASNKRIKFVSKTGTKLVNLLQRKNPFEENCDKGDCQPCRQAESSESDKGKLTKCRKMNVAYVGKCGNCEKQGKHREYHGETARNLYNRTKEHHDDLDKRKEKSWMLKHIVKEHEGKVDDVKFNWKVTGKFKTPLGRQISEAYNIDKKSDKENLNSKKEYNGQSIKRVRIDKSQDEFSCFKCGFKASSMDNIKEHNNDMHIQHKCNKCKYKAIGQKDLKYHNKAVHPHADDPRGTGCGNKYNDKGNLSLHDKTVHVDKNQDKLGCFKNGQKYNDKGNVSLHNNTVHEDRSDKVIHLC